MTAEKSGSGLAALTDAHLLLLGAVRAAAAAPAPVGAAALCDTIRQHLTAEDDVFWPLLERRAGAAVELSGLLDDHLALYELLERVEADPRPANLAELRELLEEHVAEEERVVFPAASCYLSAAEIERVAAALRPGRGAR